MPSFGGLRVAAASSNLAANSKWKPAQIFLVVIMGCGTAVVLGVLTSACWAACRGKKKQGKEAREVQTLGPNGVVTIGPIGGSKAVV